MVGKALIFFFIQKETFALVPFLNALHQFRAVVLASEAAINNKKILAMPYVLSIGGIKKTFTEREIMDGIEEIGLAYPVISREAIDLVGKDQIGLPVVLEIGE